MELRARGVSTTTFGVGDDFDEVLLQAMATAGGGHFYYIASAAAIQDLITSEVGETLDVVARDVVVEVAAPAGIQVESLSPYPTRERAGPDRDRRWRPDLRRARLGRPAPDLPVRPARLFDGRRDQPVRS
jgi:hypothetical protein